jgi:hypothetical protein
MQQESEIMKKNIAKKSVAVAKKSEPKVQRESNLSYQFVKSSDDINPESNKGCVLRAIKKLKKGALVDVMDTAIDLGFETEQDNQKITRVLLRELVNEGCVKSSRNGNEVPAKKAKAGKADKKGKAKSFKLVKK